MPGYFPILCGLMGMAVSWFLIPWIQRRFTPPMEHDRQFHHSHKTPISRFGGIALASVFLMVGVIVFLVFPRDPVTGGNDVIILTASLAMFALGLWDDFRPLGARRKLLGQILIASAVYFAGIDINSLKNPVTHTVYTLGYWGFPVTVFWLVAFTNLINLIDGIDGLAGGIALMLMSLLIYVGINGSAFSLLMPVGMAGALLGFLYFNFPPAKIYMGDGGAYFLGFFIGVMTMVSSNKGTVVMALIAPLFALALPIIDVSLAILRRGLKGLPIFRPDKKHIHHRLVEMGFSRVRTVLVLYSISAIFLALAFAVFWRQGKLLPFLFGLLCVTLLAAAGSIRFARDWFALGQVFGNSIEMRKEVRYVLALVRWFEMEAERSDSGAELWADFGFIALKVRFSRVRLILREGEKVWESQVPASLGSLHRVRHEFLINNGVALEFESYSELISEKLFEVQSELMAETWVKAVSRWQIFHETPLFFEADLPDVQSLEKKEEPTPLEAPGF